MHGLGVDLDLGQALRRHNELKLPRRALWHPRPTDRAIPFLHAGNFGLVFTKASQRATGAAITFCNVAMRVLFYAITSADGSSSRFDGDDYPMYISIAFCSFAGVWLGQKLFERMKDSQATIKAFSLDPDPVFDPLL